VFSIWTEGFQQADGGFDVSQAFYRVARFAFDGERAVVPDVPKLAEKLFDIHVALA
jgi:hypothetical protein